MASIARACRLQCVRYIAVRRTSPRNEDRFPVRLSGLQRSISQERKASA
ncbi:hypothetical protein ACIPRI_25570 [Variovorax sp. LARHSF232]